jgi:pyruvate dehydrogenase E1 component alpha subunit
MQTVTANVGTQEDVSLVIDLYRSMLTIRRFEERCNALFLQGKIPSTLHLYVGEEAVATGVCSVLRRDDYITSTHRPHGHALAKGVAPRAIMAELFAKATGCCQGKGGSMHVGDIRVGMVPAIAIVGGGSPIAAGIALSAKMRKTDQVAVCFFGEGGANEGVVHEAMNMAAVWKLPVLFVCENNLYAASTPMTTSFAIENIADRASAYGMPGCIVDGNDVLAVRRVAAEAVERARSGGGPTLIECKTYRLVGHSRSDPRTYRSHEEEAEWQTRDPLVRLQKLLENELNVKHEEVERIEQQVVGLIDDAVAFAESSPSPSPEDTLKHVYFGEQ